MAYIQKIDSETGKETLGKIGINDVEAGVADKHKAFEQTVSSAVWVVSHNLNKKPAVSTVDSSGAVVFGIVEYISNNELTITFKYPFSGTAYCN